MAEVKNDAMEKLDAIASHLDSNSKKMDAIASRMDAMETGMADSAKRLDAVCMKQDAAEDEKKKSDAVRADADKEEEAKKDAARKDAEKEEEEKKKADAAKADAEKEAEEKKKADSARNDSASLKKLQEQIDALTRTAPAILDADTRKRVVEFQSKAQRVAQAFGDSKDAPAICQGEAEQDYRIRLLSKYKDFSKSYKDADMSKIHDASVFTSIEDAIYNDAMAEAERPSTVQPGVMIPQKIKDAAGREITKYHGDPAACWDKFNPPVRYVRRILTNGAARVQ